MRVCLCVVEVYGGNSDLEDDEFCFMKRKWRVLHTFPQKVKPSQHLRWEAWEGDAWNHAFEYLMNHTRHHRPINAEGNWCVLGGKRGQAAGRCGKRGWDCPFIYTYWFIQQTLNMSAKILLCSMLGLLHWPRQMTKFSSMELTILY